ncbi:hypothetical protein FJQ98_16815 [Lysinibacillus agricola]|uniref:Phage tail-like C-terminal domain-containing protein n=1 Tax=Lysinibacillus agricola TaxID=2590012 RepID=A0ABX7ALW0_9BACI|nr:MULTISPECIES: phage tail domain-containing protein [Lysinibacillus]KOS61415.1 hypothetical protein AN161_17615 [Lysinibacillus sp. FJAT-14222]QQP10906.1 hypothetical protein FJQ98_16815 [Lysinibacillus agricola]
MKWSSLINSTGSYISKSYEISNVSSKYLTTILSNIINIHNQEVQFHYSVSYDYENWTSWKPINFNDNDLLNGLSLDGLIFRYRIVMNAKKNNEKPYVQSFSISFDPYESLENLGDFEIKPKLWIRKKNGNGTVEVTNMNTNQKMIIENLIDNEEVFIDCQKEDIVSDRKSLGVYRFDDHNDEYLRLVIGDNFLKGKGDFDMDIRHRYVFIQE